MAISRVSTSTLQSGLPKYQAAWDGVSAAGAMDAISFVTLSAAQLNVQFNNIPQTYSHLQIRWIGQHTGAVTNTSLTVQLNGDTGSNYTQHRLYADGASAQAIAATSVAFMRADRMNSPSSASSIFGVGIIDLLDYTNTNKYTTLRSLGGVDSNGSGFISIASGTWLNSAAVTSIVLSSGDTGNIAAYSSFALYGIR